MHPHTAIEDQAFNRSQYGVYTRTWIDDDPLFGNAILLNDFLGGPEFNPLRSVTINADLEEPIQRADLSFSRLRPLDDLGLPADRSLSPYMSEDHSPRFAGRPVFDPGLYLKVETKCVGLSEADATEAEPPVFQGAGPTTAGSLSNPLPRQPQWPAGHQAGDIGILYVKTANQVPTFADLAGFLHIGGVGLGTPGGGGETVAFDAFTKSATFTTTSPFTFSHTPAGTPKGVVVAIEHAEVPTDLITGLVKYGGVTMTRIETVADTTGGLGRGRVYLYFLGAGIPTGTQTVSITHSGAATIKVAFCETYTASGDTEIVDSDILDLSSPAANPQITLDSGTRQALITYVDYSDANDPADLVLIDGQSSISSHDFGGTIARVDRETTLSTGSRTVGYTAASTGGAMAAMAIAPVAVAGAGVRIDSYWCRATSNHMPPPQINVPSDHVFCQIVTARGCIATGNPVHVHGGNTLTGTDISFGIGTPDTTVPNCLLVGAVAHAIDSTLPQHLEASIATHTSITDLAERSDRSTQQGSGGGLAIVTGVRRVPGLVVFFGELAVSSVQARYTLALLAAQAAGPQDPDDIPWRPVFVGRIDSTDPAQGGEVVVTCRDIFCDVLDTWIEPGLAGGWLMGDRFIAEHLANLLTVSTNPWTVGAVVVPVPLAVVESQGPPNLFIPEYLQQPGSKLLAMRQSGLQNGWDLRGRWGPAPYEPDDFVLTYYEPDRSFQGIRFVLRPNRYFDVPSFPVSREEVRNVVEVTPSDPPRLPVHVEDSDSIFAYGRKFMALSYDVASHIQTPEQASALGGAVLSDTKDPKATMEVETRFLPFVEINDLVLVMANGVHHDTDLQMAVTGYTHTLTGTTRRTTLRLRPTAAAAYRYWRSGTPQTQFSSTLGPSGTAPEGSIWTKHGA